MFYRLQFLLFLVILSGCSVEEDAGFDILPLTYSFENGMQDWSADFCDYPVNINPEADSIYEWSADHIANPQEIDRPNAIRLKCNNVYGGIFMFVKRKIGGFKPNTAYTLVYEIKLASNAAPGEGMILKAGASEYEPKKVIEGNYYTLNIDKGPESLSGENLAAFGDIGAVQTNGLYTTITRGNAMSYDPLIVQTNSKGELWLAVGVDAMSAGETEVLFSEINVVLSVSR